MIAFTQLAIFATCLRVSEHLHNFTLVASFNGLGFPSTGELVIAVLIYIVLPAAVGIFFLWLTIWLWKKDWRDWK
jgi:hypothetical protein